MNLDDNVNLSLAVIENINLPELENIKADILRLDKIHPVISGNKWFKLKYHLEEAVNNGYKTILTYGGAYSNHIVAASFAAKQFGLRSIGIIRGEKSENLSHTLSDAMKYDMELKFISRTDFKNKNESKFIEGLKNEFGDFYMIPEGGASEYGRKGAKEILALCDYKNYSHIMCAIGTGTMYFGLVNSSELNQEIIGIPVLKGMDNFLTENLVLIEKPEKKIFKIFADYHLGGYAKKNKILLDFIENFYQKTGIVTDFVYTAKLVYAFLDLNEKQYFPPKSKVLLIHSGGLQGNLSIDKLKYLP